MDPTGSLLFEDAGLTIPSTMTFQGATASSVLTISAPTTFSQAISLGGSVTGFTKAGTSTLTIDADYGSDSGTINVTAGTLVLNAASTAARRSAARSPSASALPDHSAPGQSASPPPASSTRSRRARSATRSC